MPQHLPNVGRIVPHRAHALPLLPVRLLMPDEPVAVHMLGQDVDPPRREADARVAGRAEHPGDDVAGWLGGHIYILAQVVPPATYINATDPPAESETDELRTVVAGD
jgi:hypothetical protein